MSQLWKLPSILVALLVIGAPLLAYLGIAGPGAFYLFFIGVGLSAFFTVLLAGLAAFASTTDRPWRSSALRAAVVPMALTLGVLGYVFLSGGGAQHPIHDVTTDLADTLQFTPDVAAREQVPMPRQEVIEIQKEIYPDLQGLQVEAPADVVYGAAEATARAMPRWEVLELQPGAGRIEATATSRIFHFVDDVVIRVSPGDAGTTRVDVRSRSRMGRSDLGANSNRIRAYLSALEATLSGS
jgi:uncharacterized protein (DUF1499 family)